MILVIFLVTVVVVLSYRRIGCYFRSLQAGSVNGSDFSREGGLIIFLSMLCSKMDHCVHNTA